MAVTVIDIELEGASGGLHIALPYSMIEPIREILDTGMQSDNSDHDNRWAHLLREEVEGAELELGSVLTETQIKLSQLMNLKPGDVIPVELPESVAATVNGVPVFHCKFGASGGNLALKVLDRVQRVSSPMVVAPKDQF